MRDFLQQCFDAAGSAAVLSDDKRRRLADGLGSSCRAKVHHRSITPIRRSLVFMCTNDAGKRLGIVSPVSGLIDELKGPEDRLLLEGIPARIRTVQTTARAAAWLRDLLPYLKARPLGLKRSAGFGDRLGLATPGHVRAVRKTNLAPIFAQQSVRENERTGRSAQEVLDDAMWGAFQEGWVDGFGADADHLKKTEQASAFAAAGYSFFTIDPGEYVDNEASLASLHILEQKIQALPWGGLESTYQDLQHRLVEKPIDLGTFKVVFGRDDILRAAAKYGKAVAHTVRMYRHLEQATGGRPYEFEMSVDETDSPTALAEHVYVASELKRLKVKWVSLAP
ncbi:MAG: tagaturonate epimerase family protein, partial [Hyphomicrobiales bacterium]